MFLIKAPLVFRAVWKVVGALVHPKTKAKINISGSNYLEELAAIGVTKDQIPPSIGGTATRLA